MAASWTDSFRFRSRPQRQHVAKNRIALAPMTNQQSHADGTLSDDEERWLLSRADGGFGVVFSCASHVAKDGQGWTGELGCFSDEHVPGLTRLAAGVRARGAVSVLQIFHGGVRALAEVQPWSAVASEGVRAATADDLARVVVQFADAAERAARAGWDGVEIHGAHGYLLTQFLSAHNTRTDSFGGPLLENRARLLREVVRAVRARVPDLLVGVRLSPEDWGNAKGLDLDESLQTARWCADDGCDFVHVSLWNAQEKAKKRAEHPLPLFRKVLPDDVALLTAGSVWTADEAQGLLDLGADVVALGRAAILNPAWPTLAKDAAWSPLRPPVTKQQLIDRHLSPAFAGYMGRWKGFVVDA